MINGGGLLDGSKDQLADRNVGWLGWAAWLAFLFLHSRSRYLCSYLIKSVMVVVRLLDILTGDDTLDIQPRGFSACK